MSIGWDTGRTETRGCGVCGISVEHRETRINTVREPRWNPIVHRAPCGAWCMGGGIGSAQTRPEDVSLREAFDASHRRDRCGSPGCAGGWQ